MKYYLKGNWEKEYKKVSKKEYIKAERAAGFRNKVGGENEIATAAFSGYGVSGKVEYDS